jgi:hypothetical protein
MGSRFRNAIAIIRYVIHSQVNKKASKQQKNADAIPFHLGRSTLLSRLLTLTVRLVSGYSVRSVVNAPASDRYNNENSLDLLLHHYTTHSVAKSRLNVNVST